MKWLEWCWSNKHWIPMPDSHYLLPPSQLMDFRLQSTYYCKSEWGNSLCWRTVAANACVRAKCTMGFTDVTQTWDRDAGDLGLVLTCVWHWQVYPSVCTAPFALLVYSDLICVFEMQVWHEWCMAPEVRAFPPQLEALEPVSIQIIIITVKLGRWRDYSCSHKNMLPFFNTGVE